jgi:glycosyltransferase involved in cell wall biosynthesis
MKILFVIPSLDYGGPARQLALLAAHLPRDPFLPYVCALGPDAPWSERLRAGGVGVLSCGWRRPFDVLPFLALRRRARAFAPDVVHAWGLAALRAAALAAPRHTPVVLSAAAHDQQARRLGRLDLLLIRASVRRVLAGGPAEAERCRRLGIPADRIAEVPPGVVPAAAPQGDLRRVLGLPESARLIVCVGPLEASKGFRDAVWAFDILQFVYDDLHLVLVGRGPDEQRLREFTHKLRATPRVHFVGPLPDAAAVLAEAEVVWVPSRADRGINVALEAMAAGRPVVASRLPALAEVVADGETGVLVLPGDQAALARETRLLLDDADRRGHLGEAGRRRAAERFAVETMVRRYDEVMRAL